MTIFSKTPVQIPPLRLRKAKKAEVVYKMDNPLAHQAYVAFAEQYSVVSLSPDSVSATENVAFHAEVLNCNSRSGQFGILIVAYCRAWMGEHFPWTLVHKYKR